jgi:hypothetical protein
MTVRALEGRGREGARRGSAAHRMGGGTVGDDRGMEIPCSLVGVLGSREKGERMWERRRVWWEG